ncbi:hypothetical protein [Sinorhizobium sp. Sb3]|uniref:hypothetical protein n=1 Tax=Sinorhizobium/Ensifer group TaxID=227292 RepID=UPI00071C9B59|nr:hypothetical protein [Sinorhizobium sp. Sb3]KSV75114.1 hypothetical protein N183_22525 [Sinorhizobium sp. Sb3]
MLRILLATSVLSTWFLSCPLLQSALAAERQFEELCLVPVKGGQPTQEDFGASWRMVAKFVAFDDIPRPIIYPHNRAGVWTIDDSNRFVLFGGKFPQNLIQDGFASDPERGNVIGTSPSKGVFVARRGETAFTLLYEANDSPLRSPHDITYVPRFKGFALSDPSGLYLLDQRFNLESLPLQAKGDPGTVFDLPELNALILNPSKKVYLRDDSGETALLATLEDGDFVVKTHLTQEGQIYIKTYWNELTVSPPSVDASGRFSEVKDAHLIRQRPPPAAIPEMISGPKIWGRTFFWLSSGLWHEEDGTRTPIALPFDAASFPIAGVDAYPRQQNLIVFSLAGIYVLDIEGTWKTVPRSKGLASRLTTGLGVMPDQRGLLIAGQEGLYLLASAANVAADACLK